MLIYPQGILEGERLAGCSDEAQLHFARLVALGNGFGRMELNAKAILETAYANFNQRPSREQLTQWLQEYAKNHLLFIYTDAQEHPWGQWCGVPERMLPRFKTAADKRSPAPPAEVLAGYEAEYASLKQSSGDFINISEDFGIVPKSSEALETLPLGIGIGIGVGKGIGVGEEQEQIPSSPSAPSESGRATAPPSKSNGRGKQPKSSVKPYDAGFLAAYELYPKHEEKSESEVEYLSAVSRLQAGERDKPAMTMAQAEGFLREAAADYARAKAGTETSKIRSMRRWLCSSTYLDYSPKPKVEFVELTPEQAAAAWKRDLGGAAHA